LSKLCFRFYPGYSCWLLWQKELSWNVCLMMNDERKLLRAVVRRVHPDLFTAHAYERQRNSDSLKVN